MEILSYFLWRREKQKIIKFFEHLKNEDIDLQKEINNMRDFNPLFEVAPDFFWLLFKMPHIEIPFLLLCNCRFFVYTYKNLDKDFQDDLMSEKEFKEYKRIIMSSSLIRKKVNKIIKTFTSKNEIMYI